MPKKRLRISRASQLSNEKKKEMKDNELKLNQREDSREDEMPAHSVNSDKLGSRTKRPRATSTPHRHKTEQVSTVSAQPADDILPSTSPHRTAPHRLSYFASALSPDTSTSLEVTWDYRKTESTPPTGSDKDLSDILYHFPAIDSPVSTRNSSPLTLSILPMNLTNRRSVRNSKDKEGFEKLRHLASRLCGHQQASPCESNGTEGGEENENMLSDVDSICDRESMLDQFFADTDDSIEDEAEKNQPSTPPMANHDHTIHPPNHHTMHPPSSHSLHLPHSTAIPHSSSSRPPKSTPHASPQLPNSSHRSSHPPTLSSHHHVHPASAYPPPISLHQSLSTPAHQSTDLDDDGDDLFWAMAANALDETERQLQKEKELNETIDKLFFDPVDSPLTASCIKVCSQEDIERKRQSAKRKLKQRLQTI